LRAGAHSPQRQEAAPGLLLRFLEIRAFWEHYAAFAMRPVWGAAAKGDGHPVLILPGLAAGDGSTALMRRFLRSLGYTASGWGQGINLGLREGVLDRAHEKLGKLWIEHGRSVSLIGWSLGGLYARELANGRQNWCVSSSRSACHSPAIPAQRTLGASTSSPAAIASIRTISTGR